MKKELTDDRIEQDQLDLQLAFGVFDLQPSLQDMLPKTDINYDQYIDYWAMLMTYSNSKGIWTQNLTIHNCNETDKDIIS